MNFFTRAWCDGDVDESEDRGQMYLDHLAKIKSQFPPSLHSLAYEFPLHDGLIRQIAVSKKLRSLQLLLRCGDKQMGYFDLDLSYSEVNFLGSGLLELAAIANRTETEILYDEIDLHGKNAFEHRFIFWPTGEAEIVFCGVTFEMKPSPNRNFIAPTKRYLESA